MSQVDPLAAHGHALSNQELALPPSLRDAPVGPHERDDHVAPGLSGGRPHPARRLTAATLGAHGALSLQGAFRDPEGSRRPHTFRPSSVRGHMPRESELRLYDYVASANCYKVRLLLAQLGRPYERIPIDIFDGDTLTNEYARINAFRSTPVLEIAPGRYLIES